MLKNDPKQNKVAEKINIIYFERQDILSAPSENVHLSNRTGKKNILKRSKFLLLDFFLPFFSIISSSQIKKPSFTFLCALCFYINKNMTIFFIFITHGLMVLSFFSFECTNTYMGDCET